MRTIFETKRLGILTILAGLTYAFLVISSFIDGADDFKRGLEGARENNKNSSLDKSQDYYYLNLKPKNVSNLPDSLINTKENKEIRLMSNSVITIESYDLPTSAKWYTAFQILLAFLLLIIYIVIPIQFYRFISLISKNIFFEKENIRLLRWLGFELLIVYFGNVLYNFTNYKINSSLFSFSDYELVMDYFDGIWLLFGVVVLMIAEILSKALALKEEQELTI